MSRVFFAVRSSNSLTLFTVGVTSLRTYFFEAQPTVSGRTTATVTAARLKRFIELGSLYSRRTSSRTLGSCKFIAIAKSSSRIVFRAKVTSGSNSGGRFTEQNGV